MRIRTIAACLSVLAMPAAVPLAQAPAAGRVAFERRCAQCHGGDANGGEMGPPIATRLPALDDRQLTEVIRQGRLEKGMPPADVRGAELTALIAYLRTLQRREPVRPIVHRSVTLADGRALAGRLLGEGLRDLQIADDEGALHLLRRNGDRWRAVTSEVDWPTYNGDAGGNRFTTIAQIDPSNVARLAPAWLFTVPDAARLQTTPLVVGGVMYVTAPNYCAALDAGSGRLLWQYSQPRTRGTAGGGANRGAAVAGRRLFMVTDHAHLIAIDRFSGRKLWDTELADWRRNYAASSAPLVAGDLVISGVSGGEHGANGFVAAIDQATGREVWRFHTVPRRGEPGSETWRGKDIDFGGAPTWFTGSYDPGLDLVFWPTGNPSKEYNGDDRQGDNLYADCLLALDRRSGRLRWHYQFTPHDLWDYDATQTSIVADVEWEGTVRPLILHANRNGFFYVFDRRDGRLLRATPFVTHLTWAKAIGPDGRPIRNPGQEPTPQGTKVCPAQDGATNWFSPAFSPLTGLYYVQTFEKCSIYTKSAQGDWEPGKAYLGGSQRVAPDPVPRRILRAIDLRTGLIAWELPQPGPAESWGGVLATATGLVFVAEEGGALVAVDARSGAPLWQFQTNQSWRASPMTYVFDGRQHVAIAAGPNILAFALGS
jgi:alcohol dehydrogenase (cytochrome c)